jgi:hypothetical protein
MNTSEKYYKKYLKYKRKYINLQQKLQSQVGGVNPILLNPPLTMVEIDFVENNKCQGILNQPKYSIDPAIRSQFIDTRETIQLELDGQIFKNGIPDGQKFCNEKYKDNILNKEICINEINQVTKMIPIPWTKTGPSGYKYTNNPDFK